MTVEEDNDFEDILIANIRFLFSFTHLDKSDQFSKSNYLHWLYCIDTYNHIS